MTRDDADTRADGGYRPTPRGGPALRSDIVDVYVFRATRAGDPTSIEFLQLLRARDPLGETWHPVMGHAEADETAAACARRELAEEVGLRAGDGAWLGFWALEQAHPYYVAAIDCIVLSPRFAARVDCAWTPKLDADHRDFRWVSAAEVDAMFHWPGQKLCCREVVEEIMRPGAAAARALALPFR